MSTEIAGIVIAKGSAHPVDRFEVGRLVFGAYVPVARALGMEEAAAVDVLARALDLEQCYLAWRGLSVVGFQGLVERHARPFHFRYGLIREHCAFLRALVYFLLLSSRSRRIFRPGEMMFENLIVSPEARRLGIADRLVAAAEDYARQRGYASVGIEVVNTNHVALKLFERRSYAIVHSRRTGILTRKAGFTGNHFMRKRIVAP
jgi:ribosomal protein S18 acetylase RimI-like enzyme